ncbi:RNase H-like domain found in reverse transcriptase [Popillia japonica]|uniref:RNA-directed DNA polymerase n=1 Tax=Popillia japonica TaxID=7064 RepID=A0AAW1MSX1_POPJA
MMCKNLSPFYQSQLGLTDINSISDLLDKGRKLELRRYFVDNYVPPPRRNQTLEPDLAYLASSSASTVSTDLAYLASSSASTVSTIEDRNERKCWNCNANGHLSAQCRQPRRMHCYRCGEANGDERPYLTVYVCGKPIVGLLDSGASRTIAGSAAGLAIFKSLGLRLRPNFSSCRVADGRACNSPGTILAPIKLQDREKLIDILVVPDVSSTLILGTDFWRIMGIIPDLRKGEWSFSSCAVVETISTNEGGISAVQRNRLDDLVEKLFRNMDPKVIGCTKKDKTYRFVVDYRKLNKVTEKDAYPLPYISHTLHKLRDARYLSSLDIKSAYFQIPVAENSRKYTAFTVPNRGLFQFKRLPMGLSGSPAVWQRFIDRVIGEDLEPFVFAYLDDIIVIGPTFDKHLEVLEEVINRIHNAGLTLNRDKCKFCRDELKYLGVIVLILALVHILSCPDFSREFTIQCDSSDFGIGAVLTQNFDDGERVIAYISKSLSKQERKFSTTEKECLAVLWAIEKFRPYVEGSHFTVITDHYSLIWLDNLRNPSGRLARWAVRLQQYDFTIQHRKGKDHVVPDALSRSVPVVEYLNAIEGSSDNWYNRLVSRIRERPEKFPAFRLIEGSSDNWYNRLVSRIRERPEKFPAFRLIDGIPHKLVCSAYPELVDGDSEWKPVVPKDKRQDLIQQHHDNPTSGHLGAYKTIHRLSDKYYWPGMKSDVYRYIRKCKVCMRAKPSQQAPAGQMGGHSLISKPWEVVCADIVGPLPKSKHGNQFIFVVADCFSKYALFFPLRKATATAIVKHLEDDVFLQFGVPRSIITDNGVQFRSKEFTKLAQTYSVKPLYTTYYSPWANPTERINRVLKTMLVSYVSTNHRLWDEVLPKIACAERTARHEVIGLTPYFVNFGREMILSGTDHKGQDKENEPVNLDRGKSDVFAHRSEALRRVYKDIRLRLQQAYEKSKCRYDLRRRAVEYLPNQLVWRKNFVLSDAAKYFSAKLADKYIGPFMIHRRIGKDSYELKDLDEKVLRGTWHTSHLKPQVE